MGGDYIVRVKTGDKKNAGTDANVHIILHGKGYSTQPIKLDKFFRNDFERNRLDDFSLDVKSSDLSEVETIEFWRDEWGLKDDWYLEKILVENKNTKNVFVFPILRWIKPRHHYKIRHLDTSLPQFDPEADLREMERAEKKKLYVKEQKAPGIPYQVKDLPADQEFSWNAKWDFLKMKEGLKLLSWIKNLFTGAPKSKDDLLNLYTNKHLPLPLSYKNWPEDSQFGAQRLTGCNVNLIKLCTSVEKIGVDDEMLKPFLEGSSLSEAMSAKKIYITDLEILDGVQMRKGYVMPAPIALFYVNQKKELVPIAIQLYQKKGPNNPVFLPSDDKYTWIIAKMWYNLADGCYHQSLAHIGFTHFSMESVAIASEVCLSLSHPLYKLLAPHFLYLMAINSIALKTLVAVNGFIDNNHNYTRQTIFELARRALKVWRIDVQGTIPEAMKQRGVDNPDALPNYHYRDDGLLFYGAINKYVRAYINLYYDSEDKIVNDTELQEWGKELTTPKENGGMGILGIPGNGKFTKQEEIILFVTSVIYQCSVGHAAVNFPQYDEYGFQPNYPSLLRGSPPIDKRNRTEKDLFATLADNETTLNVMRVVKLLSTKNTESLGKFEVEYIHDPQALKIVEEFRSDLREIKNKIEDRNKTLELPYTTLHPDFVPNAISI